MVFCGMPLRRNSQSPGNIQYSHFNNFIFKITTASPNRHLVKDVGTCLYLSYPLTGWCYRPDVIRAYLRLTAISVKAEMKEASNKKEPWCQRLIDISLTHSFSLQRDMFEFIMVGIGADKMTSLDGVCRSCVICPFFSVGLWVFMQLTSTS